MCVGCSLRLSTQALEAMSGTDCTAAHNHEAMLLREYIATYHRSCSAQLRPISLTSTMPRPDCIAYRYGDDMVYVPPADNYEVDFPLASLFSIRLSAHGHRME